PASRTNLSLVASTRSPTSLVAFPAKSGGIIGVERRDTERKSCITPEISMSAYSPTPKCKLVTPRRVKSPSSPDKEYRCPCRNSTPNSSRIRPSSSRSVSSVFSGRCWAESDPQKIQGTRTQSQISSPSRLLLAGNRLKNGKITLSSLFHEDRGHHTGIGG